MKTKLRIVLASVLVAAGLAVTAGAASYDNCADQLKDLGLFQGTEDGYELDRAPTRGEAATMLVRLLGKEAEAKELTYEAPFTDLDDWQKPYVQYLYDNKLTNGATETTFEPEEACSAQMYTTFLLSARSVTAMRQRAISPMTRRLISARPSAWSTMPTAMRARSCATMWRR